jgi:hypothetical protein
MSGLDRAFLRGQVRRSRAVEHARALDGLLHAARVAVRCGCADACRPLLRAALEPFDDESPVTSAPADPAPASLPAATSAFPCAAGATSAGGVPAKQDEWAAIAEAQERARMRPETIYGAAIREGVKAMTGADGRFIDLETK